MFNITWDDPNDRYYEHGIDRGVIYIPTRDPIPFNGITGFEESGGGAATILYRDGIIYMADVEAADFTGKLTALFFPDELHECLGMPEVADGLYVDGQKPKRFGFSYRSLIGSGATGDLFGYQIHLVYNAIASIGSRSRETLGENADPVEFSFEMFCTPVRLPGYRPTAHYIIDTRNMSKSKVLQLEELLYGDGSTAGVLPSPTELFDLMNFGDAMIFTVHQDGYFTVEGSHKNLYQLDPTSFQMDNVNGVYTTDGNYVISDGGNTDVIIE